MDYPFERRRKRNHRSSSSLNISSSRDDDEIEQEIIDRAMEIERSREKSLRRQFEYIVYNVKELERRRQQQQQQHFRPSSHHRAAKPNKCQITMTYQANGSKKYGDEIMVLQENLIVFKGFLRTQDKFTFKLQRPVHRSSVKLEFYINEIFECCLTIDCDRKTIEQESDFFVLQDLQSTQTTEQPANHSRRHKYSHSSSSSCLDDHNRHPKPLSRPSRQTSKSSRLSQRSIEEQRPTPVKSPEKELVPPPSKPNYGPPQLSTFIRSSSESSFNEPAATTTTPKVDDEIVKKDDDEDETNDNQGFMGFLQLLNTMSGGSIRMPSAADDGDGIQGLLTRLGIVTQNNCRKKSFIWHPHQLGNVENNILVYLDDQMFTRTLLNQFRSLINSIEFFSDADDCIAFINTISNEKVYLIVNDRLGDPVVSKIQDLQQLAAIYVRCQTDEQMDNWSTNQPKIRAIHTDIQQIFRQMKTDLDEDEDNCLTLTFSVANMNTKDEPLFVIEQILKEILLDQEDLNNAKQELIDFARKEYENNPEQLKFIDNFQENYGKENILHFFHRNQFLYKMLNKSFRIPDVDILYKLRLFIQNLHQFIVSSPTKPSHKRIYRQQRLTNDQLETLKKCNEQSFICFSHFFLASSQRPSPSTDNEVLFEIDLSSSNEFTIWNQQILVSFGLVTRFIQFDKDNVVRLKAIHHDDQQLEKLVQPIRKETRAPYPSLRLVKLFIELEQFSQATYLGEFLLTNSIDPKKDQLLGLARIYHSLGTTLYEKEEYDQALDVIRKSHELYLKFLPEDAPQLSPTWNNMGSIYLRQGKTELALEHHEKALAIQLKSPSPDLPSIISYSNNIGGVYLKLEKYDEALVHFKRALQIEEQTLPANHPELAGTYHRIGGVYFRQNNYEKALEFYDKTLQIELASLSETHPTVAVTYHNRGTALEGLGKLDEALQSAEKAVERLLKTLPKEHPQVRMNQAYADRLRQKLWVKQLFN